MSFNVVKFIMFNKGLLAFSLGWCAFIHEYNMISAQTAGEARFMPSSAVRPVQDGKWVTVTSPGHLIYEASRVLSS